MSNLCLHAIYSRDFPKTFIEELTDTSDKSHDTPRHT